MKRFRHGNRLPLITGIKRCHQRGAAFIAAIFVMTALLVIGSQMTRLMVLGAEETINEWYSAQALYAAESGVEFAVWDLANAGSGVVTDGTVITSQSWMTTTVTTTTFNAGAQTLYTITSAGEAGGTSANPRAQRQISVQFMP